MILVMGSLLIGLSACSPDGYPVWDGYEIRAVALPDEILYFGPIPPDEWIVSHERCHQRRMREYESGVLGFYLRYMLDAQFACQEELICGAPIEHPACN